MDLDWVVRLRAGDPSGDGMRGPLADPHVLAKGTKGVRRSDETCKGKSVGGYTPIVTKRGWSHE